MNITSDVAAILVGGQVIGYNSEWGSLRTFKLRLTSICSFGVNCDDVMTNFLGHWAYQKIKTKQKISKY